ncbi:MAG: PIN domain-containing protein [Ahrensia sp.]|nr:PIN domain-containing protein [Ahrensia sp.]
MKGLDTNIIISLLFDEGLEDVLEDPAYHIGTVVLAEVAWVLRSSFRKSRQEIALTFERLLADPILRFDNRQVLEMALMDFRLGPADLPDYLLIHGNRSRGVSQTLTNDRKAARHDGFTLLGGT